MTFICPRSYEPNKPNHMKSSTTASNATNASKRERANTNEDVSFMCECGKMYGSRWGYLKHKKACTFEPDKGITVEHCMSRIAQLEEELASWRSKLVAMKSGHIDIAPFGDETLLHITPCFASDCLSRGMHGVIAMIEAIYFDEAVRSNHNVRLVSLNNQLVKVMTTNGWKTKNLGEVTRAMFNKACFCIFKHSNVWVPEKVVADDMVLRCVTEIQRPSRSDKKRVDDFIKAELVERR